MWFGATNRSQAPTTSSNFSTAFPATENPISQGGIWVNGLAVGLDWTNPKTTGGQCVASAVPTPNRYSDDIGHLSTAYRAFQPNQFAEGVAYVAPGYSGNGGLHEVELLLRFSISANVARGYEILWGITGYIAVVRWNGPAGDYTPLYDSGVGGAPAFVDGDILRAEITGSVIKVYKNGVLFVTVGADTTWPTGQPGLGFWPVDGAVPASAGWKSYTAGNL